MALTKPSRPHILNEIGPKAGNILGLWMFDEAGGSSVENIAGVLDDLAIESFTGGTKSAVTTLAATHSEGSSVAINLDDGVRSADDQFIRLPTNSALQSLSSGTVMIRASSLRATSVTQELFTNTSTSTSADTDGFFLLRHRNDDLLRLAGMGEGASDSTATMAADGRIQTVIMTWDSNGTNIYVDGVLFHDGEFALNLTSSNDWLFGAAADLGGVGAAAFEKSSFIHSIAIYNTKFSAADVSTFEMYPYAHVKPIIDVAFPTADDPNLVDTSIADFRVTRFTNKSILSATETQWRFQATEGFTKKFTLTTKANGVGTTNSGNIIDSDLNRIDMWLPPFHTYNVEIRQRRSDGTYTGWTNTHPSPVRGYETSFDRFQILSRAGTTIV